MARKTKFSRHKRLKPLKKSSISAHQSSSLFFYLAWVKKVIQVLLSPFRKVLKASLLLVSLWLGLGAVLFGTSYLRYRDTYLSLMSQKIHLEERESVWHAILSSHPTARDPLLFAYQLAVGLGKRDEAQKDLQMLRQIDPNDSRVKNLE